MSNAEDLIASASRLDAIAVKCMPARRAKIETETALLREIATRVNIDTDPPPTIFGWPIEPGEDPQSAIDACAAGMTFAFMPGRHEIAQRLLPKVGDTFNAHPGAMLVPSGGNTRLFMTGGAPQVTVRGITVEGFYPSAQSSAFHTGQDWLVENVEIRYCGEWGIALGSGSKMLGGRVHHCGRLGLAAPYSIGAEFNGVEVDNNNTDKHDPYWEAGGSKFAFTKDLVVRNCFVHHNHGPGLWTDIDNINTRYEGNIIEDNDMQGISHEISHSATIRANTLRRNAHLVAGDKAIHYGGSAIVVHNSTDVEIYSNLCEDNRGGISVIHGPRGNYETGPVHVEGNDIFFTEGHSGYVVSSLPSPIAKDVTYTANRYRIAASNKFPFAWQATDWSYKTWDQWQALGQDVNGTLELV